MKEVTKESLAQWIAELESQPHLSLREERYLAVMKYARTMESKLAELVPDAKPDLSDNHNDIEWRGMCDGWNACRYVMLNKIEALK